MESSDYLDSNDAERELFISEIIDLWENDTAPAGKKIWEVLTRAMEFVGGYQGWEGADKKKEVHELFAEFLRQTNSPGPDFVVDPAILWAIDYAVDYLCDAAKGKFDF